MSALLAPNVDTLIPAEDTLTRAGQKALDLARAISIDSHEMYDIASQELAAIRKERDAVEADRRSFTDPLNQLVKRINARYKLRTDLLEQADAIVASAMLTYQTKLEADLAAERRRLEAEAAERQRIAAAEAAAAQAKADEERMRLAEAMTSGDSSTIEAAAVAASQAEGIAASIKERAIAASTVMATPEPVSPTKGTTITKTFDYEVRDMAAFARDIVINKPQLISLLTFDAVKLRAQVKATGLETNIAGLHVFIKGTVRRTK
jgi:hypothetical protein